MAPAKKQPPPTRLIWGSDHNGEPPAAHVTPFLVFEGSSQIRSGSVWLGAPNQAAGCARVRLTAPASLRRTLGMTSAENRRIDATIMSYGIAPNLNTPAKANRSSLRWCSMICWESRNSQSPSDKWNGVGLNRKVLRQ